MKRKMLMLTLAVVMLVAAVESRFPRKPLNEMDELREHTIMFIDKLWTNVTDNYGWINTVQENYGTDTAVLLAFKTICDQLESFVPANVPNMVAESIRNYAKVQEKLTGIEGLYRNFRNYQLEPPHKHKMFAHAWQDLAETVLRTSDTLPSVPDALESVHFLVCGNQRANEPSLYGIMGEESERSLCHLQQSPHQVIYNLYNCLQTTQLKGYTMMQFSYMLLHLNKKGNSTVESRLLREHYLERIAEQALSLKEALKRADSAYWRCDPTDHVEGETYVQLTKLLQGYIQNEVDLNQENICWRRCPYYQKTKQYSCYENNLCSKQKGCGGDIVECQNIGATMQICQSDPNTSLRRYEWVKNEDGLMWGNNQQCDNVTNVDFWRRWLLWRCSYCMCLCDDPDKSDRYFSLRSVLSNTHSNRVITGVRFVKMNGVVHIQIQEGTLERYGHINESSLSWQPVDNFKVKDTEESKDYMKMTYSKRAIDLDDLTAPPEHVITGLKFQMVDSHLNIQIRATPINFTSGELIDLGRKLEMWISNVNTDGSPITPRTKLNLETPDHPLNSLSPSKMDSKNNQFLLFTHSDVELDAAQTTVPFLDAQMVAPVPPVPLRGLGVYHKGDKFFGGFVGLKVFTYEYGDHIEDSFTDLNEVNPVTLGTTSVA